MGQAGRQRIRFRFQYRIRLADWSAMFTGCLLRSPNDRLADVEAKMDEWMRAGAALGWLIDPEDRRVSIYSPHSPVRVLLQAAQVQGEGLITGFVLQLEEIWKGL